MAVCQDAIIHVVVVGFHHQKGSTVEYLYPAIQEATSSPVSSLTQSLPLSWRPLPHVSLPDGCHNYETGHVTFTLPDPMSPGKCVHGVSCYRQIDSRDLPSPSLDVTRSTVQKAVCFICRWPVYNFLLTKLQVITHAYFDSHDFDDTAILRLAFQDLNQTLTRPLALQQCLEIGVSMASLLLPLRHRLLQIVKALLLHKRVMIYSSSPSTAGNCVTAIASLFPLTLETIIDESCCDGCFPLAVLHGSKSMQPYISLQQLDSLNDKNSMLLLVGVVNPLYEKQHDKLTDVFVKLDSGLLEIHGDDLRTSLILTAADLRFCHQIIQGLSEGAEEKDITSWKGSNEWLRKQFKGYLCSLLATSLSRDSISMDDFNADFMREWLSGHPYREWVESDRRSGLDDIPAAHICEGDVSLGDVGRQLVARASDLGVLHNHKVEQVVKESSRMIAETKERVGSWWNGVSGAMASWWTADEDEGVETNDKSSPSNN